MCKLSVTTGVNSWMLTVDGQEACMMQKCLHANSSINKKLRENNLPVTYQQLLPHQSKVGSYLIGDPAYPLTPYYMKEYEKCTSNAQVVSNNMLRSARNPIECAFGRLKARWSFLTKKVDLQLKFVPIAVYACFVLHNFCESNNCYLDKDLVQQQSIIHIIEDNERENIPEPVFSGNTCR